MTQVSVQIRKESKTPGFDREHTGKLAEWRSSSVDKGDQSMEQKAGRAEGPAATLSGTFRAVFFFFLFCRAW